MLTKFLIMVNKKLSEKHGWEPSWFYVAGVDKKLIRRIKKFQKRFGLFPSGLCGKRTHRLVLLKILLDIKRRKD